MNTKKSQSYQGTKETTGTPVGDCCVQTTENEIKEWLSILTFEEKKLLWDMLETLH